MIVKQMYAEWIGVKIGDWVNNGWTEFHIESCECRRQLVPYNASVSEINELSKLIKMNFHDRHKFYTKYLENRVKLITTLRREALKTYADLRVDGDRFMMIFEDKTELYLLNSDGSIQIQRRSNEAGAMFSEAVDAVL